MCQISANKQQFLVDLGVKWFYLFDTGTSVCVQKSSVKIEEHISDAMRGKNRKKKNNRRLSLSDQLVRLTERKASMLQSRVHFTDAPAA